jgi:hypothetical protein
MSLVSGTPRNRTSAPSGPPSRFALHCPSFDYDAQSLGRQCSYPDHFRYCWALRICFVCQNGPLKTSRVLNRDEPILAIFWRRGRSAPRPGPSCASAISAISVVHTRRQ